jgi:hypothetical protein
MSPLASGIGIGIGDVGGGEPFQHRGDGIGGGSTAHGDRGARPKNSRRKAKDARIWAGRFWNRDRRQTHLRCHRRIGEAVAMLPTERHAGQTKE